MNNVVPLYTHVFVIAIIDEEGVETIYGSYPMVNVNPKGVAVLVEQAFKTFNDHHPTANPYETHSVLLELKNCPSIKGGAVSWVLIKQGQFAPLCLLYEGETEEGEAICVSEHGQTYLLPKEDCCRLPSWDWENGGWYYPSEGE